MESKQNLLIVSEAFLLGGLETHIAGEVKHLSAMGFDIHLAVGRNHQTEYLPSSCRSVSTGLALGPDATGFQLIEAVDRLCELIHRHSIDYVHCHPFASFVPAFLASQIAGIPFVYTLHGPQSLDPMHGPLYETLLFGETLPHASLVACVSEEVYSLAAPHVAEGCCVVIPNGIDLNRFARAPSTSSTRWVLVSRLDAFKVEGIKRFLLAAVEAGIGGFDILGDGPAASDLQTFLSNSDTLSGNIRLKGPSNEVWSVLGTYAGVAGMGRVVLEGGATGRPTILVGYDGPKGLLDEDLVHKASRWNFSGRGMANVGAEQLRAQLREMNLTPARFNIRSWLMEHHNEESLWAKFADALKGASFRRSLLAGDFLEVLRSQPDTTTPYVGEATLFEKLGRILCSRRYQGSLAQQQYERIERSGWQAQIAKFNQALAERDGQIANLNQAVAERDGQIANLNQAVAERDGQIANLNQAVAERDGQIANLNQAVATLNTQIEQLLSSHSWRLTEPLRFLWRCVGYARTLGGGRAVMERRLRHAYQRLPIPMKHKMRLRALFFWTTGWSKPAITADHAAPVQRASSEVDVASGAFLDMARQPGERAGIAPFFGVRAPYGGRRAAILTNQLLDWHDGRPRFGGGERYALELARLLREFAVDVTFFQPALRGVGGGEYFGFPVSTFRPDDALGEFHHGACTYFTEHTVDYDHVYYHMPEYASGLLREDGLMTCHGIWFDHDNYPGALFRTPQWFNHLHRAFANPLSVISVDTNSIGFIRSLWPEVARHMRYIPNFYDGERYRPDSAKKDSSLITILFPRRSQINRGSRIFGEIVGNIRHNVRVFWVGEGDPEDTEIIKAVCLHDKRVTFHSADFDEMPGWYQRADIVVIPTIACEGTSLSCIEALASGCAVVSTNVGGLSDLVHHGLNGLLVDPKPRAISDAINYLIENRDERERLQQAAPKSVSLLELRHWRHRWAQVFFDHGWIDYQAYKAWDTGPRTADEDRVDTDLAQEKWVILTRNAIHGGVESLVREQSKFLGAPVIVCGGHDLRATCPFDYTRADNPRSLREAIQQYDVILYHWLPDWAVRVIRETGKFAMEFVHRTDTSDSDKSVPAGLITHSPFLAKYLFERYGRMCRVVEHPIDTALFAPTGEGGRFVGAITSYYETKGLDLFLEAWSRLKNEFAEVPVRFYGAGDDQRRLEKLASSLGLTVEFCAPTNAPWEALRDFRCFVVPSRIEGFPVAILEALSMNVPVIASDLEGIREFNSNAGRRGYAPYIETFRSGNVDDLANALRTALKQADAPTSREYVSRYFSPKKHSDDLRNAFLEFKQRTGR